MTDACPKECQSLLNDVMSNCTVGTSTYLETNIAGVGDLIYQEALLVRDSSPNPLESGQNERANLNPISLSTVRHLFPSTRISHVEILRLWLQPHGL